MADGNQKIPENISREFIAYQDEEHGLGHQVARGLVPAGSHKRTSPRRTSRQTLSTLIGKQAEKAIIPLQNDLGGYDKRTLEALVDFVGYKVVGARAESDHYVLAVPTAQVMELGEANFPSAFKGRPHAIGNLPNGREAQNMLYNRIGRVHATADARDRCAAALDGLEAQGIEISKLSDKASPYRTVLDIANKGLDPDRQITTHFNDLTNTVERASRLSGQNYSKSLDAVLLPHNAVSLGRGHAEEHYDYIVVDDHLEGNLPIETRFLVLERIPPFKHTKKRIATQAKLFDKWFSAIDGAMGSRGLVDTDKPAPFIYSRALMKINTRGEGVKDVGLLTKKLTDRGIPYTPVMLNDRPQTLPMVFELEMEDSEDSRKAVKSFLRDIQFECKAWDLRFIGAYGTDTPMPESARNTLSSDSFSERLRNYAIPALLLLVAALAAWIFFMRGNDGSSAKVTVPEVKKPELVRAIEATPKALPAPASQISAQKKTPDSITATTPVSFEVIRSAPDSYWVCGNTGLITATYSDALCEGATSPAIYAEQATSAISTQSFAENLLQNTAVRQRLCDADILVVTGSASSSPYEKNAALPESRAANWAGQLTQALTKSCTQAPPTILPLSLGVAGCPGSVQSSECAAETDQPVDRQLMILALQNLGNASVTRNTIEAEMSSWLGEVSSTGNSAPLLARLTDSSVFDLNQLVWTDNQTAAQISVIRR